jgi:hypothetical protein
MSLHELKLNSNLNLNYKLKTENKINRIATVVGQFP